MVPIMMYELKIETYKEKKKNDNNLNLNMTLKKSNPTVMTLGLRPIILQQAI
jgi:hypothetical protein